MKFVWLVAVPCLIGCSAQKPDFEFVAMKGLNNWAMVIPPNASPSEIQAVARAKCAGETQCSVYGWFDRSNMATAMPMLDREAGALSFAYIIDRDTNTERALYDCRHFKLGRDRCLGADD